MFPVRTAGAATLALLGIVIGLTGCTRSPQAKEAAFLKKAQEMVAKKDYPRAALQLRNAAQAMPRDAEPYYQMGLLQLQSTGPIDAVASFRKALELNPKHVGANLRLAELMTISGNKQVVEESEKRLIAILAQSPGNMDAADMLAFTEWRLGKGEDASRLLEQTLGKFPARLQSSVALARLKLTNRDFAGAEQTLSAAVRNAPQSAAAALALGQFYVLTNHLDLAEPQVVRANRLDPKNGPVLVTLAGIQLSTNRKDEAEKTYKQLSMLPDARYAPVHALFLFQNGRKDEATAELERLFKGHPEDRQARERLVSAYLATGKRAQAVDLVTAALKLNGKDVDALIERSNLFLSEGRMADAEKDLQNAIHFRGDSVDAHYALANLNGKLGRQLMQRQQLNEVLRLDPSMIAARVQLARSFTLSNNAASALELLDGAPAAHKHDIHVIVERNWALYSMNKTAELRAGIDEASRSGQSPESLIQSGLVKFDAHDYVGARAAAEELLKAIPDDVRAARLVADTYAAQKQTGAALDRLRDIAAKYPQSAGLQLLYGEWLVRSGNRGAARAAFLAAKAANPKSVRASLALAELDAMSNDVESERRTLAEALTQDPHNVTALLMLADLDQGAHQNSAAVAHYRTVLEVESENLVALNNLAGLLAQDNPDEALKFAQQAMQAAPQNASIEDTIGWIYYRKGIYASAVRYLKSSVDRESNPRRQFHLAMCYMKSGETGRGRELMQVALSKDPSLAKTGQGW